MARKREKEETAIRQWAGEPRPLPMKYHPRALMPCQLTAGDRGPWEYLTADGKRVSLAYRGTYDNSGRSYTERLEKESQSLYKMPFTTLEAIWAARIGRLDGWWNIVHMITLDLLEAK